MKLMYFIYVYGIACSIVIDLIERFIPRMDKLGKALLYIIAGYAIFMVNGFNGYTIIGPKRQRIHLSKLVSLISMENMRFQW